MTERPCNLARRLTHRLDSKTGADGSSPSDGPQVRFAEDKPSPPRIGGILESTLTTAKILTFLLTRTPFCVEMIDSETGVVRRWQKLYSETGMGRVRRRRRNTTPRTRCSPRPTGRWRTCAGSWPTRKTAVAEREELLRSFAACGDSQRAWLLLEDYFEKLSLSRKDFPSTDWWPRLLAAQGQRAAGGGGFPVSARPALAAD